MLENGRMGMKKFLGFLILALTTLLVFSQEIPQKYQSLYNYLEGNLITFKEVLDSNLPAEKTPLLWATELLPANGNRGEDLLKPEVFSSCLLYLERFQELGINGVTIAIPHPLLLDRYPKSLDYLNFYKTLIKEIHQRGMIVDVESHIAFSNTPFSKILWDYSNYTIESLREERIALLQKIIDYLHPDYLNIGTESDTEATLTGINSLRNPQIYVSNISNIISSLDKKDVKLIAGMGNWNSIEQGQLISEIEGIDGIALHIYPVDPQSLSNCLLIGEVARSKNKFVVLDECWLYKYQPSDGSSTPINPDFFKRDVYSFFQPIDKLFLECVFKLSSINSIAFVSPFWSYYFFAYLDYSDELDNSSYSDVMAQLAQAIYPAVTQGYFSSTGDYYKFLIDELKPKLTSDFTYSPPFLKEGEPITFRATSNSPNGNVNYYWFIEGQLYSGMEITLNLGANTYEVLLKAIDEKGCVMPRLKEVTVHLSCGITSVTKKTNPFRLILEGWGFKEGVKILINGVEVPKSVFKSESKVVAKGRGLKKMVPKGITVKIDVKNPDGSICESYYYKR